MMLERSRIVFLVSMTVAALAAPAQAKIVCPSLDVMLGEDVVIVKGEVIEIEEVKTDTAIDNDYDVMEIEYVSEQGEVIRTHQQEFKHRIASIRLEKVYSGEFIPGDIVKIYASSTWTCDISDSVELDAEAFFILGKADIKDDSTPAFQKFVNENVYFLYCAGRGYLEIVEFEDGLFVDIPSNIASEKKWNVVTRIKRYDSGNEYEHDYVRIEEVEKFLEKVSRN